MTRSFKLKKILIVLLLIVSISLSGCNVNRPNVIIDEDFNNTYDPATALQLVSIYETELTKTDWTSIAYSSIPSVVAITSVNSLTGESGSGSGVILNTEGFIVTNAHVISDITNDFTVILSDDTETNSEDNPRYTATLVGADFYTDLAVLKIEAEGLIPAEFGDSSEMLIASGVMAVGYPGGLDISPSATVTIGYISATSRPIDMHSGYIVNCLQTDAAINPGNSGGALVNEYGQVIGIPTSKIAATEYEGLGFAIPSTKVQEIVNDLIEFGYITNRATIGIGGVAYNEFNAQFYNVPVGFHVQDIYATATSDAGLLVDDFITKFDGVTVNSINVINSVLQQKLPGDTIELQINRNNMTILLTVTLSDFNDVYGDN